MRLKKLDLFLSGLAAKDIRTFLIELLLGNVWVLTKNDLALDRIYNEKDPHTREKNHLDVLGIQPE